MDLLSLRYILKEASVNEPDLYLVARISKHMIIGSDDMTKTRWAMSSDNYVKSAIINLETELDKVHSSAPKKVEISLRSGHIPEIDSSMELTLRLINFYQVLSVRYVGSTN